MNLFWCTINSFTTVRRSLHVYGISPTNRRLIPGRCGQDASKPRSTGTVVDAVTPSIACWYPHHLSIVWHPRMKKFEDTFPLRSMNSCETGSYWKCRDEIDLLLNECEHRTYDDWNPQSKLSLAYFPSAFSKQRVTVISLRISLLREVHLHEVLYHNLVASQSVNLASSGQALTLRARYQWEEDMTAGKLHKLKRELCPFPQT